MPDELKPDPRADFAADFREGEAMAREWIAGRGDLPGLLHIVRDMPRRGEMGGLEAGFLSTVDESVRGRRQGEGSAPDLEKAQSLLEPSPAPEIQIDMNAFYRRQREHAIAVRLERFGRSNEAAWRQDPVDTFWRS